MRELILEANYTEFRKRWRMGLPFAFISAFRGDFDKSTNMKNNAFLRKKILEQGYDAIRLLGHYVESDGYYESMIVFSDSPERYKDFIRFLIFFGKRYCQNSVVVVDSEQNVWEYSTKQGSTAGGLGTKTRYEKSMNGSNSELDDLIRRYTRRTYELDNIRIIQD